MAIDHYKYQFKTFTGSTFPDDPYQVITVKLNDTIKQQYIPAMEKALAGKPKGLQLLLIAMTHQEGFSATANNGKGTRSYRTKNPGNVGNTDNGSNRIFTTLEGGIKAQAKFLQDIAGGELKPPYLVGRQINLKPYENEEIKKNPQYGLPIWAPGYKFKYTGQLDQFVKLYSTGARVTNNYIDTIVSVFKASGFTIKPTDTLADIIKLDDAPAQDEEKKPLTLAEIGALVGRAV